MSIILTILKIIGISLLAILGSVLLLIMLVLFVPLRYKADGSYMEGGADVLGKVNWLIGAVSLTVRYQSGQPFHIKAKVFFITVFDNLKKKQKRKRSKKKRKQTPKEKPQLQAASSADKTRIEDKSITEDVCAQETAATEIEEESKVKIEEDFDQKDREERTSDEVKKDNAGGKFFRKLSAVIEKIKFTFHKIYVIIAGIRDNIKYYWELLQQESTKQAFRLCSKQLSKIIKNIAPRKYEVKLHLGFEDPAVMGNVLAVWGMLYPIHLGKVDIEPEFDQKVMEGSFKAKGRVSVYILLWTVWLFITDKNIKRLRKQFNL